MSLEKGSISGLQFTMLLMSFIFGSSVIFGMGGVLKQNAWMAPLLGAVVGMVMVATFVGLSNRFPGKTVVEINEQVFGRWFGKLLSLFFIWFFLHLGATVVNDFVQFFSAILYPTTPPIVFALVLALVCVYAIVLGLEALARCSQILLPLSLITLVINTLLVIPQMHPETLLPVSDFTFSQLFQATLQSGSFPYGETVAFLMIISFVRPGTKKMPLFIWGFVITALLSAILVARNIAVLGSIRDHFIFPNIEAIRMVNVADVITRVEAIVAINFMSMGFLKVAVLLYGCSLGSAQLLNLKTYRPLVLPLGLLMAALSLMVSSNTPRLVEFAQKTWPIYSLPFELGLPLLVWLVALLMGKKAPSKEGQAG